MGYCFMTIGKIKDKGTLGIKYNHNFRKEVVLNADPTLINNNDEIVKLGDKTYTEAFNERIESLEHYKQGYKIRSNQVLAFEIVTTFSKEDAERVDIEQWKKDNLEWLKETFDKDADKYGSNILSMISHEDEGNIHIHTIVTPVDPEGKLNAYYYTGGRQKMRELQDTYAAKMKSHGLKRGIKGSKATHQDIKKFYTALNQEFAKRLPEPKRFETVEDYRARIEEIYTEQNLKIFGLEKENERLKIENSSLENQFKIELLERTRTFEQIIEQTYKDAEDKVKEDYEKIIDGSIDNLIEDAIFYRDFKQGMSRKLSEARNKEDKRKLIELYDNFKEICKEGTDEREKEMRKEERERKNERKR